MGRKIPAKKHRGVKDPLIQQARRLQSLKGKINAPPKDPDEQPVPRSLTELFAFQNKEQNTKEKKKKNVQDGKSKPSMGSNPIAKLKQLPGESGRGFSLRINSAIRALNEPLENQDYISLQEEDREDRRGERMAMQRERRQRRAGRARAAEDAGGEAGKVARPGRVQRLALKRQVQKEKAKEVASRPEFVYDRVSFGDVTHAPPALSVLPRHCRRGDGAERPGRRHLLLTGLLRGEGPAGGGAGGGAEQRERERRERTRLDVVAAYRAVKKQRRVADRSKRPHAS